MHLLIGATQTPLMWWESAPPFILIGLAMAGMGHIQVGCCWTKCIRLEEKDIFCR